MPPQLYTIGHSNHTAAKLLSLLDPHDITLLVDIRSTPYSRHLPHFNRETFQAFLASHGIQYIHMGDTLGGRPTDPRLYDAQGQVSYAAVRQTPAFQTAVNHLLEISSTTPTVLLCAEGDPLTCHRTLMVTADLETKGTDALHITRTGATTPHRQLIDALMETLPPPPLGSPPADPRERAIRLQASKYAHTRRN